MTIQTLNDKMAGIYRVRTENSEYIVDLDTARAMRFPSDPELALRKDGTWFQIHTLDCRVGEPMSIVATIIPTETVITYTRRFSTEVLSITEEEMIPDGWDR